MEPLFQLYKLTLLAHIATKTTDPLFHEKSEEFYELLFKCFHLISEKKQDIWEDNPWDPNVLHNDCGGLAILRKNNYRSNDKKKK